MPEPERFDVQEVGGLLCFRTACERQGCPGLEWAQRRGLDPIASGCGHPDGAPDMDPPCPFVGRTP